MFSSVWQQHRLADSTRFYTEKKLQNFKSAVALFRKLGLSIKVAETLKDIAVCKAKQKKFDAAESLVREAIAIHRPLEQSFTFADRLKRKL